MAETSLPWGGTATGDAGPYSDDDWSDSWGSLFTYDRTLQGVVNTTRTGYTGLLEVTNPSTSVIRVANGIAMVDGKIYYNTANIDETLDVPATGTNYFTVVLKKDFTAQTVRLDIKEAAGNSDGGASTAVGVPAVTQTDGTTWEISLATLTIVAGPTVVITDTRTYVLTMYLINMADDSVDTDQIVNDAVITDKILNGAVTIAKIADKSRDVFIPAGYEVFADGVGADGIPMPDAAVSSVIGQWRVPLDFVSGLSITAMMISGATGNIYGNPFFGYGTPPESNSFHNDSIAYATAALTIDNLYEGFAVALTDASVGDIVKCVFNRDATGGDDTITGTVNFIGWFATYTADS